MVWMKQGHMDSFWTSLGLGHGGPRINWCEERVKNLHFYDTSFTLTEANNQWMLKGFEDKPFNYLMIEKWFAKNCHAELDVDMTVSGRPDTPYVEVEFINGERLSLYTNGESGFRIRDQIFSSEKLRQAFKELIDFGKNIGYQ